MDNSFNHYILGVFVSLFLAILLFTKKGKNMADIILGIWLLVIGVHIWMYSGFLNNEVKNYPNLLGISLIMPFLHGPLLFYYILALTKPHAFNKKLILTHVVLPMVVFLLYIPFFTLNNAEKIEVFQNQGRGYENTMQIVNILLIVSGICYLFLNFKLLNDHKKSILTQFSNQELINLNWLRVLIYMMAVIWVIIIIVGRDAWIFTLSSVYVVVLGYFGIKQVGIFTNKSFDPESEKNPDIIEDTEPMEEKKKYAKSGLTEDAAILLHENLKSMMLEKKHFKEAELTLVELSNILNTHPNYLSQVINEKEGVSFYDYINGLRVEEFKNQAVMPENQKYTIISLAYECGFNSKSAFNRIFKKHTNLSPTAYMQTQGVKNIED
ncbi:MAG: helix-turn-helix transcriptional regulator [Saprospiraceae bacterium]|nr:helix-turn-helix transcriptional regulator [Saprospiraceae bacterium]